MPGIASTFQTHRHRPVAADPANRRRGAGVDAGSLLAAAPRHEHRHRRQQLQLGGRDVRPVGAGGRCQRRESTRPPWSTRGRSRSLGGPPISAMQLPIVGGHVEGLYLGAPTELDRFGLGDPRIVIGVNLYGAPTMTPKAFVPYRMRTLVGASLTVAPPLGQYDDTKVINLGTHRWSLKPEVGLSRASGHWIVELMAGVWLFTDNTDFIRRTPAPRIRSDRHRPTSPTASASGSGSPPTPTFTRAAAPRSTASGTSTCRRTHASDRRSRGGSTRTTRCARRSAAAPTRRSAPTSRRSPLATTTPGCSSGVGGADQRTRLRWATAFSLMPRPKCAPSPIERSRRIMFTYGR